MGRGEKADVEPGVAINALQHRTNRTFAVSAGNMDEPEGSLRITAKPCERERILEPQLGAKKPQVVKKIDRGGVIHGLNWPTNRGGARGREFFQPRSEFPEHPSKARRAAGKWRA